MSIPVPVPTPDTFSLEYWAEQQLLVARWLQPLELPDLQRSYEAILSAAEANGNCRHWLLDMRRRTLGDPAGLAWFNQDFGPRLVPTLGGPVFVAYFAMVNHAAAQADTALSRSIEQGAVGGAHYRYFNREDEALAWLAQQP